MTSLAPNPFPVVTRSVYENYGVSLPILDGKYDADEVELIDRVIEASQDDACRASNAKYAFALTGLLAAGATVAGAPLLLGGGAVALSVYLAREYRKQESQFYAVTNILSEHRYFEAEVPSEYEL